MSWPPIDILDPHLDLHPLSAAQLGIWMAQQTDPENPSYNIAEYVEISAAIDPGLFVAALRQAGYDDAALRKITHENWVRVLRKTWK